MASTVPAFKTALQALLEPAVPAATVRVGAGDPDTLGVQAAIIGNAKNRALQFPCGMRIPGSPINETYDVDVHASVVGPVIETHETLLLIAYGLIDAIVASVIAWDPLPTGVSAVVPADSEDGENVGDGWREAFVTQTLHVTARI